MWPCFPPGLTRLTPVREQGQLYSTKTMHVATAAGWACAIATTANVIWVLGGDRPAYTATNDYRPIWRAMAVGIDEVLDGA